MTLTRVVDMSLYHMGRAIKRTLSEDISQKSGERVAPGPRSPVAFQWNNLSPRGFSLHLALHAWGFSHMDSFLTSQG